METNGAAASQSRSFSWVPIYHGIAVRLLGFESRQGELIQFLEGLRKEGFAVTNLTDQDTEGSRFLLTEIDPFTFFGVFNRGLTRENRRAIMERIRAFLNVSEPVPDDFNGIPVLNNQQSWFFSYLPWRDPNDIPRLWRVFRVALGERPLDTPEFASAFDDALKVRGTNLNLTMGLFWIRPDMFIGLDGPNRQFLHIKLPSKGISAEFYIGVLRDIANRGKPFPELSQEAWLHATQPPPQPVAVPTPAEGNYWFVGAYWDDQDPPDMTDRFVSEGIWQNGYQDGRYSDEVRSMSVGDKIAIKASFTQRNNLPFDNRGKTISGMRIRAIGTIVANRGDGRTVEVEWEPSFQSRDWYFHTHRGTVWRVRPDTDVAKRLIEFAFNSAPQDYAWFLQRFFGEEGDGLPSGEPDGAQPYDLADLLASGVFASEQQLKQAYDRLVSKKNLIIQGAPGVGKTFIVRNFAYWFMGAQDDSHIQMIQFHQSYSYDDFMRGFRPDGNGTFRLQDGVFLTFCRKAREDPDHPYVFIIDEINRGNLSQIFGEILMLIEADKRGSQHSVPLVYRKSESETGFYVPENVFVIGLMNIADRSLAIVDYALRRRFSFMTLLPAYTNPQFKRWLMERNMSEDLAQLIVARMTSLNTQIAEDPTLGENFEVGHSYFCPKGDDFHGLDRRWYDGIVETEVVPLLREYWFDNPKRAEEARKGLLAA